MILVDHQLWRIGHPWYASLGENGALATLGVESVEHTAAPVYRLAEEVALESLSDPSVVAIAVVVVSIFPADDPEFPGLKRLRFARVINLDELRWVEALERLLWLVAEQREAA